MRQFGEVRGLPGGSLTRVVAAVGVGLLAAGPAAAQAGNMPTPTGKVEYKLSLGPMAGKATLIWAESGKKMRQEINMTPPSSAGAPAGGAGFQTWTIVSDGKLYMHMPAMGQKVTRMTLPKGGGGRSPIMMTLQKQPGAKKVGAGKVLGTACDIIEVQGARIWASKDLVMKMETAAPSGAPGGSTSPVAGMKMEAVKLEKNVKVDAAAFKVPAGMQVEDRALPSVSGRPAGGKPVTPGKP